jgi:hypothetical protein
MPDIFFSTLPQYVDRCEHTRPGDIYHGSVNVQGAWYDVYSYDAQGGDLRERLGCFRFGGAEEDYVSPGPLESAFEQFDCCGPAERECLRLLRSEVPRAGDRRGAHAAMRAKREARNA